MSFINLMASNVWTDADILNRTESLIASEFPNVEILKRKVTGMMLGQYALTPDEQAEFGAYAGLSFQAGQDADLARSDMALLLEAMSVQAAIERLRLPLIEPVVGDAPVDPGAPPADPDAFPVQVVLNQEAMDEDIAQRDAAQATVAASSVPAHDLAMLRSPEPVAEPAPEPGVTAPGV